MNEIIKIILTSTVISAIVSSIFQFLSSHNNNKAEYIAKHRTETKNTKTLRKSIGQLRDDNLNVHKLKSILENIKNCLNVYSYTDEIEVKNNSMSNEDIEHDLLLWITINNINEKIKSNKNYKNELEELIVYVACLLKFDWDRYQNEVSSFYKKDYKLNYYENIRKIYKKFHNTDLKGACNFYIIVNIIERNINLFVFTIFAIILLFHFHFAHLITITIFSIIICILISIFTYSQIKRFIFSKLRYILYVSLVLILIYLCANSFYFQAIKGGNNFYSNIRNKVSSYSNCGCDFKCKNIDESVNCICKAYSKYFINVATISDIATISIIKSK